MKICGIIVEYNPFHYGHKLHIQKARELTNCDILIAVMSGNFTQRGEPAIINKWKRAEAAITHGVDCVIELPYFYATQSASFFAQGALACLKLAKIDTLVFGSESNNLEELEEMAFSCIHVDNLKEALTQGFSFPKAYGLLAKEMGPNDILGVSYLKALQGTSIKPYSIQRTVHYHDPCLYTTISSASAIRKAYFEGINVEPQTPMAHVLAQEPCVSFRDFYPYLRLLLSTLSSNYLKSIFLFSEGIENHLKKQALLCPTFEEFIEKSTTRRYTSSRIKRCCLQLLNQVTKEEATNLPPLNTIRVLAFNEKGRNYLKKLRKEEVSVASKFSQIQKEFRDLEFRTTVLYSSALPEQERAQLLQLEIAGPLYIKKNDDL